MFRGTARQWFSWGRSQPAAYSKITPSRGLAVEFAPPPCHRLPR